MKSTINRLALALAFAALAFFTVFLNPDSMRLIDKFALFGFGILSGVNLGIMWVEKRNPSKAGGK
ncbi:MAG: hypothetical protein R3C41_19615 [Calditrichia bacterium]